VEVLECEFAGSRALPSCRPSDDAIPVLSLPPKTGLAVDYDAVPKMVSKYQLLLDTMAASDMPETYQYRIVVEKMCRYRIKACLDYPDDPEMVEELCNCGQVEELVVQADDEMEVLQMILKARWWERIPQEPVPMENNPDPTKDVDSVTWEETPIELKRKE
jgi:NADH dehydrogenase (ubiquinone) 1 alpha subcomplex subunit 5